MPSSLGEFRALDTAAARLLWLRTALKAKKVRVSRGETTYNIRRWETIATRPPEAVYAAGQMLALEKAIFGDEQSTADGGRGGASGRGGAGGRSGAGASLRNAW